jgi:hypothetical protein
MVMEKTIKRAAAGAGGAAVGEVGDVVDFAGGCGLVAAAGMLSLSTQETEQASWMTC